MSHLQEFITTCHNHLVNGENIARRYLLNDRHLTEKTLQVHQIGYCPRNMVIPDEIRYYGEDLDDQERRDWFWSISGRVIVPIYDEFGKAISLATRKPISEGKNPWWNLPFKKRSALYLLDKARRHIFKQNKVYILEGYVDGLVLHQHNLFNSVVIMGTAFTLRKIALIARYAENVCFCFDADENQAGQKASDLSVAILQKFCFIGDISIIDHMPNGEDPASFVSKNGLAAFLEGEKTLSSKEIKNICKKIDKKAKEAFYAK